MFRLCIKMCLAPFWNIKSQYMRKWTFIDAHYVARIGCPSISWYKFFAFFLCKDWTSVAFPLGIYCFLIRWCQDILYKNFVISRIKINYYRIQNEQRMKMNNNKSLEWISHCRKSWMFRASHSYFEQTHVKEKL